MKTIVLFALLWAGAIPQDRPKKIVLIAGSLDTHPKETHEYEKNVLLVKHCLDAALKNAKVEVHFNGWPADPKTLDDADTIFMTSGGCDRKLEDHPLYVGDHLEVLGRQMKRGCGIVFYHWSTFHPVKHHDAITEWVGGYFDYETGPGGKWFSKIATKDWTTEVAAPDHPIARGVKPFPVKEEFYFNLKFRDEDPRLKFILLKEKGEPRPNAVGWAVERTDGGRGFGFTGGHYFANWFNDDFRKLVLNAIAWTAKIDVPAGGIDAAVAEPVRKFLESAPRSVRELPAAEPSRKQSVLPPDPGLEGGKGGHWGTKGESDWVDARWNAADVGPFMSSSLKTSGGPVVRAISVRLGTSAACFDTDALGIRAGWTGGFLSFSGARYGLIEMPRISGEVKFHAPAGPLWDAPGRYVGLHLRGDRLVFEYEIEGSRVLDSSTAWEEGFGRAIDLAPRTKTRTLTLFEGPGEAAASGGTIKVVENRTVLEIPPSNEPTKVRVVIGKGNPPADDLESFTKGGPGRWGTAPAAKGQVSRDKGPYVIDTLPVPYDNPWKALLFLAGIDFFSNGDAAVCSIHGDVWRVSGIDETLEKVTWKRMATGLYQALGLRVVNDAVYVLGRDQITKLHDRNDDGEADFYEAFFHGTPASTGGHDYITCLETDPAGNFYFVSWKGLYRVSKDGKTSELLATGFRNPNGLSVGPDGTITVAPQEGEWTPASAIAVAKPGGHYGYGGPKVTPARPLGYDPPLCWIPRAVDNSTGGQAWVTSDRWGPLQGQLLSFSFGQSSMMLVLREQVDGLWQGGVVPFRLAFASGAVRGRFHPRDGQLYVVGTKGWVSNATRDGSLQRVRYTGAKVHLPVEMRADSDGLRLRFTEPLDKEIAESGDSWALEQWNYLYGSQYGSKEFSAVHAGVEGHDAVEVKWIRLSEDGRTVYVAIPSLRPVMQLRIRYSLRGADGTPVKGEIDATIHSLGK